MKNIIVPVILIFAFLAAIVSAEIPDEAEMEILMQKAIECRAVEKAMKSSAMQFYGTDADSAHSWDAVHYHIAMEFFTTTQTIAATTIITGEVVNASLDSVDLHLAPGYTIGGVRANGVVTGYSWNGQDFIVALDRTHTQGESFEISISYSGTPPLVSNPNALYGMGIRWGSTIFTYTDPEGARAFFPCYDKPYDKATYSAEYTVPQNYIMASNGNLDSTVTNPNNTVTTYWTHNYQIETYLISISCSNYAQFDTLWNGIPLEYYVYPSHLAAAQSDFQTLPQMMQCYSERYGDYPFEKYGMAEAPIFYGGGAMEHQTMTTLGNNCINGFGSFQYLYTHELSHMWWGDAVSLVDWDHMWLNEGFATYSEAIWAEWAYGWNSFLTYLKNSIQNVYKNWETPSNRHPLVPPPPGMLFSTVVYEKGGSVLHMLRYLLGGDFFDCLNDYFETYKYGFVNTDDFQEKCEEYYGDDLDWFFQQWVYEEGFPVFEYLYTWEVAGPMTYNVFYYINQIQDAALPDFRTYIDIAVYSGGSWVDTVQVWIEGRNAAFNFQYTGASPDSFPLDPDSWILCNKTYLQSVTQPQLSLSDYDWDTEFLYQGSSAELVLTLYNAGLPVFNLEGSLFSDDPEVSVPYNLLNFGDLGFQGFASNENQPVTVGLDANAESHWANFQLALNGVNFDTTLELKIPVGAPEILLVDDDGGASKDTVARNALSDIEAVYREWEIQTQGNPSGLSAYPAVFWNTGHSAPPLNEVEVGLLIDYLNGGGNLFITGSNIASGLAGSEFLNDYLKMEYTQQINSGMVNGVSGDPISDDMQLFLYSQPPDQDAVSVMGEGVECLIYFGVGLTSGVRYEGSYKTVAATFAFEDIRGDLVSMTTPAEFAEAVFTWLGIDLPVIEAPVSQTPLDFALYNNYPNPFNPVTSIGFSLPKAGAVRLSIYNTLGQEIELIAEGFHRAGNHTYVWDGGKAASGLYFYRLEYEGGDIVRKCVLMK